MPPPGPPPATACPYCSSISLRSGPSTTSCLSCGRITHEHHLHAHPFFPLLSTLNPLPLVLPDIIPPPPPPPPAAAELDDEDPFLPSGFVSAFSTFSLSYHPFTFLSASSVSGHLAELERALSVEAASPGCTGQVSVDCLRAYLQIVDVASILRLEGEIADHAFDLFKECCLATCLRNRSVEALATAALVQAIREAQEPRTLQEISTASNLPQKEIGKYIKILGEALQLSQPLNSNSIAVHMPRFCNLLQLNKSAQELAAHIGEVVVNKCFCTRRNPISISAAAIYLACQLEDKRKTQAEICKVTGLTEVTLRKVYKELLENWNDLLPPNYLPTTPLEKAFPLAALLSGRSISRDMATLFQEKLLETSKQHAAAKGSDVPESDAPVLIKDDDEKKEKSAMKVDQHDLNHPPAWPSRISFSPSATVASSKPDGEKGDAGIFGINLNEARYTGYRSEKAEGAQSRLSSSERQTGEAKAPSLWHSKPQPSATGSSYPPLEQQFKALGKRNAGDDGGAHGRKDGQ